MNNRIRKYLDDDISKLKPAAMKAPLKKCVVVVNEDNCIVTLTYDGDKLQWCWSDSPEGIDIGDDIILPVHPLAAEAFIVMEIGHYVSSNGIDTDNIVFVDQLGRMIDIISFHPKSLGAQTPIYEDKRKCLIHLYLKYLGNNNNLTEDMILLAQEHDVLEPFLTLVNV